MNEPRPGNGHTCEVDGCFALAARVTDQWFQIPNDPVRCHVLCGAHWEDLLDKLEKSARLACKVDDHVRTSIVRSVMRPSSAQRH